MYPSQTSSLRTQRYVLGQVNGAPLVSFLDPKAAMRLQTTCFRGRRVQCAGNFCRWHQFEDFMGDSGGHLRVKALAALKARIEQRPERETHAWRCELQYDHAIGWASTDDISRYPESVEMEVFEPNAHSTALRMPLDVPYKAPTTNRMTIAASFRRSRHTHNLWEMPIYTLYPGPDIGRLEGNISVTQGIVFFGLDHPGADI